MPNLVYTAEFDNWGKPKKVGTIQVVEIEDGNESTLILNTGDETKEIIHAYRDQWGTYVSICGITIAQEDQTRSFLDGLIKCLQKIRDDNEHETKSATITEPST